jgi:aerobic-type carbon monoxide dehydrogenase small subunit (CoxS/CutS family)
VPAGSAAGARVDTVATVADPGLVEEMARAGAAQCGYCLPGVVVTLSHLLKDRNGANAGERGDPAEPEVVREALAGHLCRCTGYTAIIEAAIATARTRDRSATASSKPANVPR